jgi:hypothetical protein
MMIGLTLGLVLFAVLSILWIRRLRIGRIRIGRYRVGSVYVFVDKSSQNIVKIGMTGRLCMMRKEEVSRDMAEGAKLSQIYAVDHLPFPLAVEQLAHSLLKRRRVRWPASSPRGIEWFYARGPRGRDQAIAAVERAAKLVRLAAKRRRRWPEAADGRISVWRLADGRVTRYRLFS